LLPELLVAAASSCSKAADGGSQQLLEGSVSLVQLATDSFARAAGGDSQPLAAAEAEADATRPKTETTQQTNRTL